MSLAVRSSLVPVAYHVAGLLLLVIVASAPVGPFGLAVALFALAVPIYAGLSQHRGQARRVWLGAHLHPDGPLARLLSGRWWLRASTAVIAAGYVIAVYCTLYVSTRAEMTLVAACALGCHAAMRGVRRHFTDNFRESSASLYFESTVFHVTVFLLILSLSLLKLLGPAPTLPAGADSAALSEWVIHHVRHPVHAVQSVCRTLVYFDLQLRLANRSGFTGHLVYMFFLLPNLVPLHGMIWFFRGLRKPGVES